MSDRVADRPRHRWTEKELSKLSPRRRKLVEAAIRAIHAPGTRLTVPELDDYISKQRHGA